MPVRPLELPIQGLDDHDSVALEDLYVPNLRNVRSDRGRIVTAPGGTLLAPAPTPGSGFGMRTGLIPQPTTTGNQVVAHGLGVAPKVLILYTAGNTAAGVGTTEKACDWGVGITDATASRTAAFATNAGAASQTARRYTTTAITILSPASVVVGEAAWVSWDATNFTINWTTVDGTSRAIGYMVLGHAALNAKLIEWGMTAATGNQAVVGAGFTPQVVIHLYAGVTAGGTQSGGQFGMGAMSAAAQFGMCVIAQNGVTPHNTASTQSQASAITMLNSSGSATSFAASYVSLDVDGFTVNRTVAPSGTQIIASLCLGGFTSAYAGGVVGSSVTPPGTSSVSNLLFAPTGIIQFGASNINPGLDVFIGAADGTGQASSGATDGPTFGGPGAHTRSDAFYVDSDYVGQGVNGSGDDALYTLKSLDSKGFTMQVTYAVTSPVSPVLYIVAFSLPGVLSDVIRNYGDLIVGGATPTEKIVMLTSKSAYTYQALTSSTGQFNSTSENYTGTVVQRFSIANGTDAAFGAVAAWSQGKDNIRAYNGTAFSGLITSGTNHAARTLLAFNSRIVSVRPFFAGVDHKTQIRWCINGTFNDWAGTGSGTLEVVETSNQPLTSGVVIGGKCYLTRAREIVELIATGSLSPVFVAEPRVPGVGCIATHSMAAGDIYAFWLGPDEVYQWDGSQLKAVGGRVYNTISSLVDYENLDQIQAVVYEPDSQYWLVVPPYVFVYDYRRQIWDWDDTRSFQAIGRLTVQDLFTADIDHSEFVVIGDSSVQTIRVDPSVNTYLGAPIDAYFETKDLLPYGKEGRQWAVAYDKYNSLWRVWFRGTPGERIEVAASTDKGLTYPSVNTRIVTVNAAGVGIAFFDMAWGVLRIRFRSQASSVYSIQGQIQAEFQEAGYMLP